ncbi:helix-turn-helix transcriptional regulator [Gynurincola endophyticus]|jgi:putative transcriptional regulator|uniref:helix-turn-helix transcriptional regulator n=1 Tax=Gynurincola endophyticus TaxID=2479004 RepID=UPI000F8CE307|nr:helix-turn-helix transcriptional regulator [Gynurincola endophyticus]
MLNKVKEKRTAAAFTQEEMAQKIGVSRQTIHAIESGKYVPSTILALKLALFLKCNVEDLFSLTQEDLLPLI